MGGIRFLAACGATAALVAAALAFGQTPPSTSGVTKAGMSNPGDGFGWVCENSSTGAAADAPAPPPGVRFPYGAVRYDAMQCSYECGFLCWPNAPQYPVQKVLFQAPSKLPGSASVYVYATRAGMTTPVWQQVNADVSDTAATFYVDGNDHDREMHGYAAIGVPDVAPVAYQDLWWGGSSENGWGASISQSGDRLFMALYVYRDDGSPVWAVMPGGSWDAAHHVYTGALYSAMGSSFRAYDASRLTLAALGSASLTFSGDSSATLAYTIGSVSGTRQVQRQPVAAQAPRKQGAYAGLWWGGSAKNGWGVSMAHQNDTLFAVWFTYDASGQPQWYVMPGGWWVSSPTTYSGTLYRTVGSPWVGGPYDPSKLQVIPVGMLGFDFAPGGGVGHMSYTVDGYSAVETIYKQPF